MRDQVFTLMVMCTDGATLPFLTATIPFTVQSSQTDAGLVHASYSGTVDFKNIFDGKLAATDYPKIQLYLALFVIYLVLGAVWGFLCYKHSSELLPIQVSRRYRRDSPLIYSDTALPVS